MSNVIAVFSVLPSLSLASALALVGFGSIFCGLLVVIAVEHQQVTS